MSMSIYTSGDIAHKCHVSTRTIQYYDKQEFYRQTILLKLTDAFTLIRKWRNLN